MVPPHAICSLLPAGDGRMFNMVHGMELPPEALGANAWAACDYVTSEKIMMINLNLMMTGYRGLAMGRPGKNKT